MLSKRERQDQKQRERFWEQVTFEPNTGCWLWTGAVNKGGYGVSYWNFCNPAAHRVSFIIHHGKEPEGILLHQCDVRACVNPQHLKDGTPKENFDDMMNKGRHSEFTKMLIQKGRLNAQTP